MACQPFAPCSGLDKGKDVGEPDFKPLQVQWEMEMGSNAFYILCSCRGRTGRRQVMYSGKVLSKISNHFQLRGVGFDRNGGGEKERFPT